MNKLKVSFLLSFISYVILISCLIINWALGVNTWVILCIKIVPLLMFIPGIMRGYYRAFSWLCFLVLMYFTGAVLSVMGPDGGSIVDWVQLSTTVVLFNSAMMFSRWRQRQMVGMPY